MLSSRPENAAASARDWVIAPDRSYADYREMAKTEAAREDGIEAVSICTPNWIHAEMAKTFLVAGVDVILDKPMTTKTEDARMLLELTKELDRKIVMTYPYSHHAMARQARAMIANGAIGTVRQLYVEYLQEWNTGPVDFAGAIWRRDPEKVGRSSLVGDIGTHAYHLIHTVTGLEVAEVRADMHICGVDKPVHDTAFINLRLSNGAPGFMYLTQAAPGQYCGLRLRVWGDQGGIEWDQERPEFLKYVPLGEPEQHLVRGMGNGMLPEAEQLVHLPRGHGEALTDAWSNLYSEAGLVIAAHRTGSECNDVGVCVPGAADGVRGMLFIDACVESVVDRGSWTPIAVL